MEAQDWNNAINLELYYNKHKYTDFFFLRQWSIQHMIIDRSTNNTIQQKLMEQQKQTGVNNSYL